MFGSFQHVAAVQARFLLDVGARHPEKAHPTDKKLRPKDRPLANDLVSDAEFDRLLVAWFGNLASVTRARSGIPLAQTLAHRRLVWGIS